MATGIWMAIMGMIFFYLVYLFKRFVLGKSKDQIQLEELKEKEIDIITSNSIFKSKSKKEKQLADVRNEIESLNSKIKHEIINEKVSLPKAVINHSKDIASEIKPTIDEYKEKHSTTKNENLSTKITEDKIYEKIMIEIEEDKKVKSTWAKALAQSDGDKDKAESIYIKFRFVEIKNETYKDIELEIKQDNKEDLINDSVIIYGKNPYLCSDDNESEKDKKIVYDYSKIKF